MARGKSGRIVLEVDPIVKRKLYLALEKNQVTLKDWFLEAANTYISTNRNTPLFDIEYVAENTINEYLSEKKDFNEKSNL